VVKNQEATQAQEAAKKISLESELETSVGASFNTFIPSIMVGNKKETLGGAYECLNVYINDFDVWHPRGSQGSTGLRYRIRQGTTTVTGRLEKLRNTITTDSELIEMTVYLSSDSAYFIMEMLEYITTQYEDYTETHTFKPKEALSTVLDSVALIFEELHSVRSEVINAGQHNPGMFMWGFLKAW
jgi:hypothetical protein